MACPHRRKKHIGRALLHLLNLWWLAPVAKTWELDLPPLFLLHWARWQVQWRMERTFTFRYRSSGRGLRSDIRKPRKNRLSFVDIGLQEVHEVLPGKVRNGSRGGSKKKRPLSIGLLWKTDMETLQHGSYATDCPNQSFNPNYRSLLTHAGCEKKCINKFEESNRNEFNCYKHSVWRVQFVLRKLF